LDLILEVFLAVLLCTAIGYGIILNRRIKELRKDQDNLDKLAKNFAKATSRAEASIQQLKVTSDATSQALDRAIKQASGNTLVTTCGEYGELSGPDNRTITVHVHI